MATANMSMPQKVALAAGTSAVLLGVCHYVPKLIKKYYQAQAEAKPAEKARVEKLLLSNLYEGITSNNFLLVKKACDQNVNVNYGFFDGKKTPLMIAAEVGNKIIVQELLHHGADCLQSVGDIRAIDYAITEGHSEVEKLLKDAATEKLWRAIDARNAGSVLETIAAGGDLESRNKWGIHLYCRLFMTKTEI